MGEVVRGRAETDPDNKGDDLFKVCELMHVQYAD